MIVTNLRMEIDDLTFEPRAVVDCKISLDTLQDISMYNEDVRNDLYLALGMELVGQIRELRINK